MQTALLKKLSHSSIIAVLLGLFETSARAEISNKKPLDIPYGIEALTHYRSEYNYRGFILAGDTIDLQLGTQFSLNNSISFEAATWLNSGIGEEKFTEQGYRIDCIKEYESISYIISGSYRSYDNTFFEDGINIEIACLYSFNSNIGLSNKIAYDTGADGLHIEIEGNYYRRLNDDTYFDLSVGTSAVNNYYDRNGFNNAYANVSVTYNINQSISITPYLETSILLDNSDMDENALYAGVYFAVSF